MSKPVNLLDHVLAEGVAARAAPGLVAMVGNAAGVTWSGVAGERAPGIAMTPDTVFRIYSMTKAIGATAAMILIDRGRLSMDTLVADILAEFSDIKRLDGFDGDVPRYVAPKTPVTIRHLATHTAGFGYDIWNPDLPRWRQFTGSPGLGSGLRAGLMAPLAFEPGTRWNYGIGIDWLGAVVEAVDGRRVERFCAEEIFGPLGMADTGFEVEPHLEGRLGIVQRRGEDEVFAPVAVNPPVRPEFYGMGSALYSTAGDYMRFLRMILNGGTLDGATILSPKAVRSMLANQIGDLRVERIASTAPATSADIELFPGTPKTHSFGFLRVEQDVPGMRSAGSQGWAGLLNTHYWFDPAKDVIGLIMTQTLPFLDPSFAALYARFERAVYASL